MKPFKHYFKSLFDDIPGLKITVIYLILGSLWIVLSDKISNFLVGSNMDLLRTFQISKGLFFILITALILYSLMKNYYGKLRIAHRNLTVNEERYKTFLGQSMEGVFRIEFKKLIRKDLSPDEQRKLIFKYGYIAECNKALNEMYSMTSDAGLAGKDLEAFWPSADQANKEYISDFVNNNYRISGSESSKKNSDGNVIFFLSNLIGITNEKYLMRIWGMQLDITDLKNTEVALKESEELYRMVVQNLTEGLLITDVEDRILFANQGMANIIGYTVEEMIGQIGYSLFIDRKNWPMIMEKNKLRYENKSDVYEVEMNRINGEKIWVCIHGSPYRNSMGKIIGTIGVINNITKRKLDAKALKESEKKYRSVVEAVREVIYQTDDNGNFTFLNPYWTEITGYKLEESLGKSLINFVHPAYHKYLIDDIIDIVYGKKEYFRKEAKISSKNGRYRWIEINARLSTDDEGKITGTSGTIVDIHERKLVERALIIAKDKAEESDELKSNFLAQISHEIRTPLNIILSYNTLIKDYVKDYINNDLHDAFDSIDNSSRRLLRTIDLILNMAAVQQGEIEIIKKPVDINMLLRKLIGEFKTIANEKKIELIYNSPEKDFLVSGDEYTLSQAFQNLLDNAVKYTNRGKVRIDVNPVNEEKIEIEIADTGIGISKDYLPRVFDPFSQEEGGYSRSYEGNGLGLALTKKYIELNNSIISVESEKGIGTTFKVSLSLHLN